VLQAQDEDNIRATAILILEKQTAKSANALEIIRQQLAKSGDTPFQIVDIDIQMEPAYFIPVAILNQWRRNVLDGLLLARLEKYPQHYFRLNKNEVSYPVRHLTFRANVLNARARAFYKRHGVEHMDEAAEAGPFPRGEAVMTTKYCLRYELGYCKQRGRHEQNQGPLILRDEHNQELTIRFDCAQCEMKVFLRDANI
jgi:putative protease